MWQWLLPSRRVKTVTDNVDHQNLADELTSQIEKRKLKTCLQNGKKWPETNLATFITDLTLIH